MTSTTAWKILLLRLLMLFSITNSPKHQTLPVSVSIALCSVSELICDLWLSLSCGSFTEMRVKHNPVLTPLGWSSPLSHAERQKHPCSRSQCGSVLLGVTVCVCLLVCAREETDQKSIPASLSSTLDAFLQSRAQFVRRSCKEFVRGLDWRSPCVVIQCCEQLLQSHAAWNVKCSLLHLTS